VRMKQSRLSDRCKLGDPGTIFFNSGTNREGCLLAVNPVLDVSLRRYPTSQEGAGVSLLTLALGALATRILLVTFFNVARTLLRFAAWAGAFAWE
jgi:hypothetical protein